MTGRTLYDVTQLLESGDDADRRVRRVLELLNDLVPYEQCALLEARLGQELSIVLVPETSADDRVVFTRALVDTFGRLVDADARPRSAVPWPDQAQLAVPLVGLDEVIGLLMVRSSVVEYSEDHVRALSVIAANLAAYFTIRGTHADLAELVRQRDEACRAVEEALRAKDDLLALVSSDPSVRARLTDIGAGHVLERKIQAQSQRLDDLLGQACLASAELRQTVGTAAPARPSEDPSLPGVWKRGQLG